MGNQPSGARAAVGRQPSDREMMVLLRLQKQLFARLVASPAHLALLERYWRAACCAGRDAPPFARSSPLWRERGGFSGESPAADLRCAGELGLRCLVTFAEAFPAEASMMRRRRGGYPFAKAAAALVRALGEALHLVDERGRVSDFPVTRALFWQLLEREESFYRLFALLFLRFEELYCEEVARNRALLDADVCSVAVVVRLVDEAKRGLLAVLNRAPADLDELRGLCGNGAAVLDAAATMRVDDAPVATAPATSRWKERGATRKSMSELGRNWGKPPPRESCVGAIRPGVSLKPRAPDIVARSADVEPPESRLQDGGSRVELPDSDSASVSDGEAKDDGSATKDLFEGLVVSDSSISLPTAVIGTDGILTRCAAPMS